jgi:hypothetical protein
MSLGGGSRLGWSSPLLLLGPFGLFATASRACLSFRLGVLGRATALPLGSRFAISPKLLWFLLLNYCKHREVDKRFIMEREFNNSK